jgi:hypothetical protein
VNNRPVEGLDYPDLEQIAFARGFAQMRRAAGRAPLPDIVHLIARRSPHSVMYTQPRLVIDQTRRVVRAVRRASL